MREPCDRRHGVCRYCGKKPVPLGTKECALRHAAAVRMRLHNALRHSTPRACSLHVTTRAGDDRGPNRSETPQAYVAHGICVEQLGSAGNIPALGDVWDAPDHFVCALIMMTVCLDSCSTWRSNDPYLLLHSWRCITSARKDSDAVSRQGQDIQDSALRGGSPQPGPQNCPWSDPRKPHWTDSQSNGRLPAGKPCLGWVFSDSHVYQRSPRQLWNRERQTGYTNGGKERPCTLVFQQLMPCYAGTPCCVSMRGPSSPHQSALEHSGNSSCPRQRRCRSAVY